MVFSSQFCVATCILAANFERGMELLKKYSTALQEQLQHTVEVKIVMTETTLVYSTFKLHPITLQRKR